MQRSKGLIGIMEQAIVYTLGYPPELDGNNLLQKTTHALIPGLRWWKQKEKRFNVIAGFMSSSRQAWDT